MYSVINSPVLGFDLSRRHDGSRVADLVTRALCLRAGDLSVVVSAYAEDADRDAAWLELAVEEERAAVARTPLGDRPVGTAAEGRGRETLPAVEEYALGDLDGLLRFLRHEVLGWTWRGDRGFAAQSDDAAMAAAVLCDAAAAAYCSDRLSPASVGRLSSAWLVAKARLGTPVPELGPRARPVATALQRLREMQPSGLDVLRADVEVRRTEVGEWARAMHNATWAVELSGRARAATTAQMLLVSSLAPVLGPRDCARGAWNLLSGVVQALVVEDVLDAATMRYLVPPSVRRLGLAV